MATKEQIENELNQLKQQHENLALRYKGLKTKLEMARYLLNAQAEVINDHLKDAPHMDYLMTQTEKTPDVPMEDIKPTPSKL